MHRAKPQVKGLSLMEKTVPKNVKYSHVRGTLDTGLTIHKVKLVTAREYSKRRDEIFFRIKKEQLYELLSEYEQDEYENVTDTDKGDLRIVSYNENSQPIYDKPYLILDVREIEDFNNYHILQARTFPFQMLRRDQMHQEVYRYRNKPETLIIVCCNDEIYSRDSAKTLVDRGVDNVYLLTGGINEFAYEYPSFIEGQPPLPPKSYSNTYKPSKTGSLHKIPENETINHQVSGPLTPGKLQHHNRLTATSTTSIRNSPSSYSTKAKSESGYSTGTGKSVAESVISRAVSRKGKF